jgi:hypothetical protein
MPDGPYFPTTELVAVAWLSQRVPGLAEGMVATSLPKDVTAWATLGFVQVQALPGGTVDIDTHVRHPVLQVDAWAANPGTLKAPWNKAARLVELIRVATEDGQAFGRTVQLPPDYSAARVLSVYPVGEPTRVTDDPSGYARYTLDLAIDWVRQ